MKIGLTFDDVQIIPRYSEVDERDSANLETQFTKNFKLKIPLVASPMDTVCEYKMASSLMRLGGVGVIHRFMSIEEQVRQVEDLEEFRFRTSENNKIPISAAIGVNGDSRDRALSLLKAGATVLIIDVAHGHHQLVKNMMEWLCDVKGEFEFDIVVGSVATKEAAEDLQEWGADALRVGVGGGSVCETRIRTGVGIPQLQSIIETAAVTKVPIISDGGIRYPGDAAKALAAGADSIMIGSLFAGTDESPGETFVGGIWPNNKPMKVYRGLASATTKLKYAGAASHVEGASKMIECRGSVVGIVNDIVDGITSSMSYVGASSLEEFRTHSRFIKITTAGLAEAHPHLLK